MRTIVLEEGWRMVTVSSRASRSTRQAIVEAAAECFRQHGYGATSIGLVAEQIGISKGNLTYHFPNKQALFQAVHQLAVDFIGHHVLQRSFEEAPDTLTGMDDFLRRVRRYIVDDSGRFLGCLFTNVTIETQHTDEAIASLGRSALSHLHTLLAERFALGQERGDLRADVPADDLARQVFWMYEGALILSRAMNDPCEFDAFARTIRPWLAPPTPEGRHS